MWHSVSGFMDVHGVQRRITWKCNHLQISPIVMKIRIVTFIKHFRFSVHNIRQAIQAYYRIQTDGRTDLNFNFEPVSSVSRSVKFSWILSESIVLKVEIEDRNLFLALLQKIPGSAGKNVDFRFNYTPECMVSSMHFQQFSPLPRLLPRSISGCALDSSFALKSRALRALDRFGLRPQFTPSNMCINPSPNRRGLNQTMFPNPNFLSFPTLDPKYRSKST